MKQTLFCALFVLAVSLGGCATSYQGGVLSKGADARWLSSDQLVVTARGNAYTSEDRVGDYCVLKAAEETINAGFRYMVTTKTVNISQIRTHYVDDGRRAKISALSHDDRPARSRASDASFGETILIRRPGRRTTYRLYKEPPQGLSPNQYIDAYAIYNSLGPANLKRFTPARF